MQILTYLIAVLVYLIKDIESYNVLKLSKLKIK